MLHLVRWLKWITAEHNCILNLSVHVTDFFTTLLRIFENLSSMDDIHTLKIPRQCKIDVLFFWKNRIKFITRHENRYEEGGGSEAMSHSITHDWRTDFISLLTVAHLISSCRSRCSRLNTSPVSAGPTERLEDMLTRIRAGFGRDVIMWDLVRLKIKQTHTDLKASPKTVTGILQFCSFAVYSVTRLTLEQM